MKYFKINRLDQINLIVCDWIRIKRWIRSGPAYNYQNFDYIKEKGLATSKGFGVMKANPDKSKHLETATIKIMDVEIDLVNLRTEDYTDNSRIPNIKINT